MLNYLNIILSDNRIGDVMVSLLASIPGRVKPKTILVYVASLLSTHH